MEMPIYKTFEIYKKMKREYGSSALAWQEYVLKLLPTLIEEDTKEFTETEKLILLGCVLYDTLHLSKGKATRYRCEDDNEHIESQNKMQAGNLRVIETQERVLFNRVSEFCNSIEIFKTTVCIISDKLETLKEMKLTDLESKDEFEFSVDSFYHKDDFYKEYIKTATGIPNIKVHKTYEYMEFKTKEIAYKYIYSVFVKYAKRNNLTAFLPIMIFQSIFHNSSPLFKAVDGSFLLIRANIKEEPIPLIATPLNQESSSKEQAAMMLHVEDIINHIKEENTYLYKSSGDELPSNRGFQAKGGLSLNVFSFHNYYHPNKKYLNCNATDWYNYFFELCELTKKFGCCILQNYVAFLCLSDIFDLIFINNWHYKGIFDNNLSGFCLDDNLEKTPKKGKSPQIVDYRLPIFDWSLHHIYEEKKEKEEMEDEYKSMQKKIYDFLLNYMGIKKARERLK